MKSTEPKTEVPTLAGERSNEAPVLIVDKSKAEEVAKEILLRNEERKRLGLDGMVGFYVRERYFG